MDPPTSELPGRSRSSLRRKASDSKLRKKVSWNDSLNEQYTVPARPANEKQERIANARSKSLSYICSYSDLSETMPHAPRDRPLFTSEPPPYLGEQKEARYKQQYDKLITALNQPIGATKGRTTDNAANSRKELRKLWFECRGEWEKRGKPPYDFAQIEQQLAVASDAALQQLVVDAAASVDREMEDNAFVGDDDEMELVRDAEVFGEAERNMHLNKFMGDRRDKEDEDLFEDAMVVRDAEEGTAYDEVELGENTDYMATDSQDGDDSDDDDDDALFRHVKVALDPSAPPEFSDYVLALIDQEQREADAELLEIKQRWG